MLFSAGTATQPQALTKLEALSIGDLALETVELSSLLHICCLRSEAVGVQAKALRETSAFCAFDRVAETLRRREDLQ